MGGGENYGGLVGRRLCGCGRDEGCSACTVVGGVASYQPAGTTATVPSKMHQFASGAKSTIVKPRYDLCPPRAIKLMANRFQYGADRHGERNYTKGAQDPTFIRDRINHLTEHVLKFAASRQTKDLEAILCNAAMLAELKADDGAGGDNASSLGGDSAL